MKRELPLGWWMGGGKWKERREFGDKVKQNGDKERG